MSGLYLAWLGPRWRVNGSLLVLGGAAGKPASHPHGEVLRPMSSRRPSVLPRSQAKQCLLTSWKLCVRIRERKDRAPLKPAGLPTNYPSSEPGNLQHSLGTDPADCCPLEQYVPLLSGVVKGLPPSANVTESTSPCMPIPAAPWHVTSCT